jgi:serine/threonine-protein kinase
MKPIHIGDVVGDYRVIDVAGSGGMGAVYKIEHLISKRIEAMKLLPPASSSDPEQVHRFEREIQVQARLHHPNIVGLYNAVRDGDFIALVMEYVEGESLQRKLESGPLPVATALNYTGQILCALSYAHEAGVIHRDVGPANIIITDDGTVKLMDFGLARGAADLRLSTSGVPLGSPWYMSPEQIRAVDPIDARADIYATGAVLHEMLTGKKLFDADGAFAVMRAHVEATPKLPSAHNPEVPAALDETVRKAVEKDPAMRFQSAAEFALALQAKVAVSAPVIAPVTAPVTVPVIAPATAPVAAPVRRNSRAPRVMAMAAASVLGVAICAVRLIPAAKHVKAPVMKPPAAVVAMPVPVTPAPAAAAPEVPVPPPAVETAATEPAVVPRHREPVAAQAKRPRKAESNFAIKVTGGEPAATVPAPAPRPAVEAIEPPLPESAPPPEATATAAELPAAQDAAPAKPASVGSRLVRALGKVNPFHKGAKRDGSDVEKMPLKKD